MSLSPVSVPLEKMSGVLLAVAFFLVVNCSPVAENVEILLAKAETVLATFKAELEAEDAQKVVETFGEMVKTDAALQQAIVLLRETHASAELETKVQAFIDKFDRAVPHAEPDRAALTADILDKNKGIETMKKLLSQLKTG